MTAREIPDCNCGAQDRAEHRPHKSDCKVYALRREDGLTWGEFTKDKATKLARIYRTSGASDIVVEKE